MSSGAPIVPDPKPDKPPKAPQVIEKSTSVSQPTTFTDVINMLVFLIMVGAAVYYGWKLGRQHALKFWMVVQMIGQTLREYIAKAIASLRSARDARKGIQATARLSR
jgi:hypothetical protein